MLPHGRRGDGTPVNRTRIQRLGRPEIAPCGIPAHRTLELVELLLGESRCSHVNVEVHRLGAWWRRERPIVVPVVLQVDAAVQLLEVEGPREGLRDVRRTRQSTLGGAVNWAPKQVKRDFGGQAPRACALPVRWEVVLELAQEGARPEAHLVEDAKDAVPLARLRAVQGVHAVRLKVVLMGPHRVLRAPVEVALHQRVALAADDHLARRRTPCRHLDCVAVIGELDVLLDPAKLHGRPFLGAEAGGKVDGALLRAVLAEVVGIVHERGPVAVRVGVPVRRPRHGVGTAADSPAPQRLRRPEVAPRGEPADGRPELIELHPGHRSRLHDHVEVHCLSARRSSEGTLICPVVLQRVAPVERPELDRPRVAGNGDI
mmetsp:Transcript_89313/g.253084  ORF Transcript_89313/g.253084 Transcript_89313/m.253084 type:complete len:373 (+) Transcript_89313:1088-2206(+)